MVDKNCNLGIKVSLKELPPEGGIYAESGEGFSVSKYYDRTATRILPVLFFCKDTEPGVCLERLGSICNYLQSLKKYPQGSVVSWLNAETAKEPGRVRKDEEGFYYYSCTVNCSIYF